MEIVKKMKLGWKIILHIRCYTYLRSIMYQVTSTITEINHSDFLYIFAYYLQSVYTINFSINMNFNWLEMINEE